MKKLSLILAFVLVLSCFAFAACGEKTEESSVAESAAESNAASTAESKAEESTATSTEESVEASTEESTSPSLDAGENVALNKAYTTSNLFRQNESWSWSDDAEVTYLDEDGKSLTDGKLAANDASYKDVAWAGFNVQSPDYAATGYHCITVDLGAATDLVKFAVDIATSATGAGGPQIIEVYVSADGSDWGSAVATLTAENPADSNKEYIEASLSASVNGQYVQYRFTATDHSWMFVAEVEAYAAK